jgi:hypothetical protein
MPESPFESIDSAHHYVQLLVDQIAIVEREIVDETAAAASAGAERRVDALRLVSHKLERLHHHLRASSRVLNDLRTLHRLLTGDTGHK